MGFGGDINFTNWRLWLDHDLMKKSTVFSIDETFQFGDLVKENTDKLKVSIY